jgi:hypothetical protein
MSTDETTVAGAALVASRMAIAAQAWLSCLDADQRTAALYAGPTEDADAEDERLTWFFTPTDHGGLTLNQQSPAQQSLAMQLVSSGLSMGGYVTATTIMGTENILDRLENWEADWGRERGRDPGMYYLRIFGDPLGDAPWGWRFGGHHISLNNLIVDRTVVSTTPNFFGSDPAEIPFLGGESLRPLGGSEDLARSLLHSLDEDQREVAILLDRAISDIVSGNRVQVKDGDEMIPMPLLWRGQFTEPRLVERITRIAESGEDVSGYTPEDHHVMALTLAPKGLPASRMNDQQRYILRALIASYYRRVPPEMAADEDAFYLDDDNLDAVHFAWAGGRLRHARHYYRVQGPRLLLEYDNTQRGGNHVHTVWRDLVADFGLDVLAEHLEYFPHEQ